MKTRESVRKGVLRFAGIAKDPEASARRWKETNQGPVIGFFCSYLPEEVIVAAGGLPFRISRAGGQYSLADGHLQAYCCSPARGALEAALSGQLEFLDGVVFAHTCDAMQRLSDIWRLNIASVFHLDVAVPSRLNSPGSRSFLEAVFRRYRQELEAQLGRTISEDALSAAVKTGNRVREGMARLYALGRERPDLLSGTDLQQLSRAVMVMDRKEAARVLSDLADELRTAEVRDPAEGPTGQRILLSGSVCPLPGVHELLEQRGARVVWDDFCTGARYYEGRVCEQGEPLSALAARFHERGICPAKHAGLWSRGNYLLEKVRQNRADGIIFLLVKFCDPQAFDLPDLRQFLERHAIPSAAIELEDASRLQGGVTTRCEAFLEMLGDPDEAPDSGPG